MPDQAAFVRIIKENEGILYKITRVYAADQGDQEDLYQEVVYQLWKSFDSFRHESKVSTWVYRIALNTSITHLKKQKRRGNRISLDFIKALEDPDDGLMEERLTLMYDQIRMLNEVEKGIILLHLEGKNYEEISAITGFTSTNIGTRLHRIKEKLKSQINK